MSRYESHNLENQAMPFIYRSFTIPASRPMFGSSNWHENIEILYATDGEGAIANNGNTIRVSRGDAVVVNANHLHAMAAVGTDFHYRCLIVDRLFCVTNGIDTNSIMFDSKISDKAVGLIIDRLDAAYTQQSDAEYRILSVRVAVLELMLLLCEKYSTPLNESENLPRSASYVKSAIDYISASYAENFSLEDAAKFVGVDKCYLSREFHKYTGYHFVAYVNRVRCKMAQNLLLNSRLSICEIGKMCGFENRSYFARSFKRYIGILPGECRAAALRNKG